MCAIKEQITHCVYGLAVNARVSHYAAIFVPNRPQNISRVFLFSRYAPTKRNTLDECANSKLLIVNLLDIRVPWVALALPRSFVMQIFDAIIL